MNHFQNLHFDKLKNLKFKNFYFIIRNNIEVQSVANKRN